MSFVLDVLTLSSLNLTLSSSSTTSRDRSLNSRFVVDEDDLKWLKIKENCNVLVNQFRGNLHSEALDCREAKCFLREVKWCFNASWGLKGLNESLFSNFTPDNILTLCDL